MENFNPQILEDELPKIENLVFQPLERNYLRVLIWAAVIRTLIFGFILLIAYLSNPYDVPELIINLIAIWYVVHVIWTFIKTIQGFNHKAYAIRDKDIIYKTGWLWKSMTTTPFNRVQHITLDQGPIERQFNLARIRVFTAGGAASDLTIPGLKPETAEEIKEFIVKKTQLDEEE